MSATPYGFTYTSFGGDVDGISYGGSGGEGLPPMIDSTGREIPAMGSGQLAVTGMNNSKGLRDTATAAVSAYGLNIWGKIKQAQEATTQAANAANATVAGKQIDAGVQTTAIAADVQKAQIAAEVAAP